MKTSHIPTQNELRLFVRENELNLFEEFTPQMDDVIQTYLDVDTYIEDNREDLVEQWQKITPATLQEKYNRALALYNESNERAKHFIHNTNNWPMIFSNQKRTLNLLGYQMKLSQEMFKA